MIVRNVPLIHVEGDSLDLYPRASAYTEKDYYDAQIATGTSNKDIYPADIAATDLLIITSNQALTYVVNGADTSITLDADGRHILDGTNVTSLTISNSSGSTARVRAWFFG